MPKTRRLKNKAKHNKSVRAVTKRVVKEAAQAKKKATGAGNNIFAGIDWGTGEHSYNALILYVLTEGRRFELHMKEMLPC